MMNTAEQQQPSGLKGLLRAVQKEETTPKGKTPLLSVDDKIKALATSVKKEKELSDSHKTSFERLASELIEAVSKQRDELCKSGYTSSVRVPTTDNLSLTIVWSGNYIKIVGDKEPTLMSLVGEKYGDYFRSRFALSVKGDLGENELTELVSRIGEENFVKWFESEEVIKPTERFVQDHVLMSESMREQLALVGVKQYKASVKSR